MSAAVNMPGSVEFLRNGPTRFLTTQTSAEEAPRKTSKRFYFTIIFTVLGFVTFGGFAGFLYYLDVRLNDEIKAYNLRLSEEMRTYNDKINAKILEYEVRVKYLTERIEIIGSKNSTTSKSPLQSETAIFRAVTIENIEEFPEIEQLDEGKLIHMDDIRANRSQASRGKATKHAAPPPPLMSHQNKFPSRTPWPLSDSAGDENTMNDQSDSVEVDDKSNDTPHFLLNRIPLRERRKKSVEFARHEGGNLIETTNKQFQNLRRLKGEIEICNLSLCEAMKIYSDKINDKIREYENKMQLLSDKIEDIVRKNTTKPPQLSFEEVKFLPVKIQNIEEFPQIELIDESTLINVDDSRANNGQALRENTTKNTVPASLIVAYEHRSPFPWKPADEIGSGDIDDEIDSRKEQTYSVPLDEWPLRERHKRSVELAGSGGGNVIDTSLEQLQHHDKSNKSEFSKLSSQNRTVSAADVKTQSNNTPTEEPCNMPISQKISNRRCLPLPSPTKKVAAKLTSPSHETEEHAIAITETRRTVVAAHFGADSSKYSKHTHSYYDGNTHLRHPTGKYEDWQPSPWFDELNMDKHFVLMNGDIKVHTSGLYFVYAQIFYSDLSDVNGYEVYLNSQVVLQCITSTYSLRNVTTKSNTCYTGGVIKCQVGDKISVKTVDTNRRVMLEASRSFVGMFKIGEFQSIK